MFSVPDWGKDEDLPSTSTIKESKKSNNVKLKTWKSDVTKKLDSVTNSPGLTQELLNSPESGKKKKKKKKKEKLDSDTSNLPELTPKILDSPKSEKKKKKKKKKKNKVDSVSKEQTPRSKNNDNDTSSSSTSSAGHILRQGIKFSGFEEFCKFVDSKKGKKRKKSNSSEHHAKVHDDDDEQQGNREEEEEMAHPPATKKAKFSLDKIRNALKQSESKEKVEEEQTMKLERNDSKAQVHLKTSRFRFINEKLYVQTGSQSLKMFKKDPEAFQAYHTGFQQQARKWPKDPLQTIITSIIKRGNDDLVIADFGCGEAKLAQTLTDMRVHSFDLVALNDHVTACDMANTPLGNESVDISVFCLSLMGTNLKDYLKEANRVLKMAGTLKIAEVESRFLDGTSVEQFTDIVEKFGFKLKNKDVDQKYFVFLDFEKIAPSKKKVPELTLKPCFYKKR